MCRLAGHDKKLIFLQNVPLKSLKSYSYHIETMYNNHCKYFICILVRNKFFRICEAKKKILSNANVSH